MSHHRLVVFLVVVSTASLLPAPAEATPRDLDNDGLRNTAELALGTDPRNADSDGGGVGDGVEVRRGTNPLDASDDAQAVDADGDGYSSATDCDDSDPRTYPNAPEMCGGGVDYNCDGVVC